MNELAQIIERLGAIESRLDVMEHTLRVICLVVEGAEPDPLEEASVRLNLKVIAGRRAINRMKEGT
jgi:hypothetical protein